MGVDGDKDVITNTGGVIAAEIKGKVGGTVKSCESACLGGSIWKRTRGKPRGEDAEGNCHTASSSREELLLFINRPGKESRLKMKDARFCLLVKACCRCLGVVAAPGRVMLMIFFFLSSFICRSV